MAGNNGSAATIPTIAQLRKDNRAGLRGSPFDPFAGLRFFGSYGDGAVIDSKWDVRDVEAAFGTAHGAQLEKNFQTLALPIRSAPWEIKDAPGGKSEGDAARDMFGRLLGPLIDRSVNGLWSKKVYHELEWDLSGREARVVDLHWRPTGSCEDRRDDHGRLNGFFQRLPFTDNAREDTRWPGRVWIEPLRAFVYINGRNRNPIHGHSDLQVTWALSETIRKLSLILFQFLELQAVPRVLAYGTGEAEAGDNADALAAAVGGGVIPWAAPPDGSKPFDVLEASGNGAGMFLETLRWLQQQQVSSILADFSTLADSAGSGRGSYALSSDQRSWFESNLQAKATELADQITEQVLRPAALINFGPDARVPSMSIGPVSSSEVDNALQMLNSTVTSPNAQVPPGVVDALWIKVSRKLGLDVDQVREAVEEWRDAGQPAGDESDADEGVQLAHTVDLTYGLVTDALAGVDPRDALEQRLELARRVRTPEGARRYGVPVGSPIPEGRKRTPRAPKVGPAGKSTTGSGRTPGKIDGSGRPRASRPETSAPRGTSLADAKSAAKSSGQSRFVTRRSDGTVTVSTTAPNGAHYRVSPGGSLLRVDNDGTTRPVPPAALPAIERSLAGTGKPKPKADAPAATKPDAPAAKPARSKANDNALGRAAHAADQPDVTDDGTIDSKLSLAMQRAGRTGKEQFIARGPDGDSAVTDVEPDGTHIRINKWGQVYNVKDGEPKRVADTALDKYTRPSLGEYKPDVADGPTPDGRPANPKGKAVADRIDTTGLEGASRKEAHIALDAIAKVHSDGDTRNDVRATSKADPLHRGTFTANAGTHDSDATDTVDNINVKTTGETKALTFTHEVGHYLDRRGLGVDDLEFSSRGTDNGATSGPEAEAMRGFLDAARGTDALRLIGERADGVGTPGYREYLESPHEMWARAYAQFIATRSQDRTMMRQLRLEQDRARTITSRPPTQWEDDDFAPVDAAIEKVLRAKGWM